MLNAIPETVCECKPPVVDVNVPKLIFFPFHEKVGTEKVCVCSPLEVVVRGSSVKNGKALPPGNSNCPTVPAAIVWL